MLQIVDVKFNVSNSIKKNNKNIIIKKKTYLCCMFGYSIQADRSKLWSIVLLFYRIPLGLYTADYNFVGICFQRSLVGNLNAVILKYDTYKCLHNAFLLLFLLIKMQSWLKIIVMNVQIPLSTCAVDTYTRNLMLLWCR